MTRPEVRRRLADARAKRIRIDLAYRKNHDEPGVYENSVERYRADGYGVDGYPLDYPDDLKTLD
ncbi:hypothetical protein [Nonomuraea sp. NPDC023979]|uniref:hypothetical protein n=1 Tax=Nonomuraea sp. NPDC023979 TaxID=3154796 RepID=UPI0034027BA4